MAMPRFVGHMAKDLRRVAGKVFWDLDIYERGYCKDMCEEGGWNRTSETTGKDNTYHTKSGRRSAVKEQGNRRKGVC
jgi:hypothetical protein